MQKSFTNRSVDTIIFDVDGTLFNGQSLSLPIIKNCLSILIDEFHYNLPFPSDKKILAQFGKQAIDIFTDLLPEAPPNVINSITECVQKAEIIELRNGVGNLYDNVSTVLSTLKDRGYKLAICTNAPKGYFRAIVERFKFKKYFQVMLAAGLFIDKDKNWMVKEIIKKLKSKNFAVVGDRHHDIDAAKANNGISVGCAYGFGFEEVEKADFVINDFQELLNIFK